MTMWDDGTNPQMVCKHYGYSDIDAIQKNYHAYWPKDTVMARITQIPEFLQLAGMKERKFRIILDYDPEFPRAMVRVLCDQK